MIVAEQNLAVAHIKRVFFSSSKCAGRKASSQNGRSKKSMKYKIAFFGKCFCSHHLRCTGFNHLAIYQHVVFAKAQSRKGDSSCAHQCTWSDAYQSPRSADDKRQTLNPGAPTQGPPPTRHLSAMPRYPRPALCGSTQLDQRLSAAWIA